MDWLTLQTTLIYTGNGLLALLYGLADHWAALAALGLAAAGLYLVDAPLGRAAGGRSLRYGRGATQLARPALVPGGWLPALLWLLAAWFTPAPVPLIGLGMWLAALAVPLALPLEKRYLVNRLRWFIGVYAALALGFLLLARHPLTFAQAAAWSERLQTTGGGEALEWAVRAQFIPYLALVLWVVYPLTYFGYVAQQLATQRRLLVAPWQSAAARLAAVRARGE